MSEDQGQLLEQVRGLLDDSRRAELATLLSDQRSSDVAEIIEILGEDEGRLVLDLLPRTTAAEVLEKVDPATRSYLFDMLGTEELAGLISELDADDAADLMGELEEEKKDEVAGRLDPEHAARIKSLMKYSEDSAGGIMDPILVRVHEDATVGEAINKIRLAEIDEDFYSVFVTDRHGKLLGDVRIRYLITKPEHTKIADVFNRDFVYVPVDADQEEVRNIFKKNDLIVVPVTDKHHRLVGRITADRVIEVAEEEAAEDMYVMAGTDAAELESFSVFHAAKVRMTWLLPCLAGTAVTAVVALFFKNVFIQEDLLFIFITAFAFAPMIAAISGNAGLQTSAIVVCGLATGDLAALRIRQVFGREVRVAVLVAISCGLIGAVITAVLPHLIPAQVLATNGEELAPLHLELRQHVRIVAAFGTAMFSAIMVATTLGLLLPFLFRRVGIDPAISSGPLVTTANDSISVAIYLTLTLLLVQ
jgi:magnesium transporter